MRALEGQLEASRYGAAVRIEIGHECPEDLQEFLLDHFSLHEDDMYLVEGPVNLNRLSTICGLNDRPELLYPPFTQGMPDELRKQWKEYLERDGDPAELAATAALFGAAYRKVEQGSAAGYLVDHSAMTYIIDRQGRLGVGRCVGQTRQDLGGRARAQLAQGGDRVDCQRQDTGKRSQADDDDEDADDRQRYQLDNEFIALDKTVIQHRFHQVGKTGIGQREYDHADNGGNEIRLEFQGYRQ